MKARPVPDLMASSTLRPAWLAMKPTMEKMTNPAKMLVAQLEKAMRMASLWQLLENLL